MKLAYAATFNASDIHKWSGTPYYMADALSSHVEKINYVGSRIRLIKNF